MGKGRFSIPGLELGKRKPSRQGSSDSNGSQPSPRDGTMGAVVPGTPREGESGPGSSGDELVSPGSGDEGKPRRRTLVTRIFRPMGGKKRMKAQVARTPSIEGVEDGKDAPKRRPSIDKQLTGMHNLPGAAAADKPPTATQTPPAAAEAARGATVANDLPSNVTVRQQPTGSVMPAVPPPLPIKSMSVESTGQAAEDAEDDDAPLTPGGPLQSASAGELLLTEEKEERTPTLSKESDSRDSIFSMLLGSVSGIFGLGKSGDSVGLPTGASADALLRLGSDDSAILNAREGMLKGKMSTSDVLPNADGDFYDTMSALTDLKGSSGASIGSLPLSDSAVDDKKTTSAARTVAYGREEAAGDEAEDEAEALMGTETDLCSMIDLAQLEEMVWDASFAGSELAPLGHPLSGGYDLNYDASAPPMPRGESGGVAVSELATMLAHGGSSMDVLRVELALPSPSDLIKGPAAKKGASKKKDKEGKAPSKKKDKVGSFANFALSWSPRAEKQSSSASSSDAGAETTSAGGSSPSGSSSLGPPTVNKKDVSTASTASSSAGARNTLGRKEWSAEEDAIIMAEVEKNGQKWRVIAARLPGRSDDAVRNRWKRLSAEAAGQAAAVADALGIAALPSLSEGGDGAIGDVALLPMPGDATEAAAAPKKESKPKAERLAWTKDEDAEIIRCVQAFGLKWGRISQNLPGRTAHAIRNRFHRLQQLQQEQATATGNVLPSPRALAAAGGAQE